VQSASEKVEEGIAAGLVITWSDRGHHTQDLPLSGAYEMGKQVVGTVVQKGKETADTVAEGVASGLSAGARQGEPGHFHSRNARRWVGLNIQWGMP
jgi:hypothetical protein